MFTLLRDSKLPEYGLFDYEIKIKDGEEPKFIPIYLLSQKELAILEEYIKDNLKKGNKKTQYIFYPFCSGKRIG